MTFLSCSPSKKDSIATVELTTVIGSWDLNRFINHLEGGTDWEQYADTILYQKIINDTHFTWFKYDTENDKLLGMGGGNYQFENNIYQENIEFFYPPGSSELGQSIPFEVRFEGGEWYHNGVAKITELNIENGELEEVGENKIEEIWRPSSQNKNPDSELSQTWDLLKYRESLKDEYIEYPKFMGYIKLINSRHFAWTMYNKEGDEIYAAGAGTYSFDDSRYTESIYLIHPQNTGQVGRTVHFDKEATENQWKHFGYVPEYKVDESTGDIMEDSILIDEYWIPHEMEITEELFF